MSTCFSLRAFGSRFRNAKDTEPEKIQYPSSVSEELAKKFIRVLRAKNTSEIADISAEEICEMINNGADLASIIDTDNILSAESGFYNRLLSSKSVLKRRIL